jgi:hypothetical protein
MELAYNLKLNILLVQHWDEFVANYVDIRFWIIRDSCHGYGLFNWAILAWFVNWKNNLMHFIDLVVNKSRWWKKNTHCIFEGSYTLSKGLLIFKWILFLKHYLDYFFITVATYNFISIFIGLDSLACVFMYISQSEIK